MGMSFSTQRYFLSVQPTIGSMLSSLAVTLMLSVRFCFSLLPVTTVLSYLMRLTLVEVVGGGGCVFGSQGFDHISAPVLPQW